MFCRPTRFCAGIAIVIGLLIRPTNAAEPTGVELAAAASNHLGCELYRELTRNRPGDQNLAFSPVSAAMVLAMVSLGTNAEDSAAIQKLLATPQKPEHFHATFSTLLASYRNRSSASASVSLHNSFWADQKVPFSESFLEGLQRTYGAEVQRVNFRNRTHLQRSINAWIGKQTRERLRNVVPLDMLHPEGTFVAVNAMWMEAEWASQFEDGMTRNEDFFVRADQTISVPMMNQVTPFRYAVTDVAELVEMPYRDTPIGFVLVVPRKGVELARVEAQLSWKELDAWDAELRSLPDPKRPLPPRRRGDRGDGDGQGFFSIRAGNSRVTLAMPKFDFEVRQDLRPALEAAGLSDLFRDVAVSSETELKLYSCRQFIRVEVDEKRTRVAAATAGGGFGGGGGPPVPDEVTVRADRPFLFYIRDRDTRLILAMGRVANPLAGQEENEAPTKSNVIRSPGGQP